MPTKSSTQRDQRYARKMAAGVITMCVLSGGFVGIALRGPTYDAEQIAAGRVLFTHDFTVDDPLCGDGDGLGPVFNATSCVACHFQGGVGGAGDNSGNVTTFEVDPDRERREVVTHVVHQSATRKEFKESTRTVRRLFRPIPGGVRVIGGCSIRLQDHNPVHFDVVHSPALFGVGLIDEIPDSAISLHSVKRLGRRTADNFRGKFDHNSTGFARSPQGQRLGRFGWKGQFASLSDFVAAACAMELGLSNRQHRQPIPREHNPDPLARPDMTDRQLDDLIAFVATLPRPRQVVPDDHAMAKRVEVGQRLFDQAKCNDCHVEQLGDIDGLYSDFMLYSLEDRRMSGGGYGGTVEVELEFERPGTVPLPEHWQTPPLWGVADSAPYFHDGASPTLSAAIDRHHGAAGHSRKLYRSMQAFEKEMLIDFLRSLRAPRLPSS
ncbi:MAG: di-heme oxidoredictase family protein [Planctomycetota bacterium]